MTAMRRADPRLRRYLGFAAAAALVAGALAAVGAMLGGESGRWPGTAAGAVAGCAAALAASLAGGLVVALGPSDPRVAAPRALGATGVRLAVLAALVAGAALGGGLAVRPLLLWAVLGHLALLAVDTRYALAEAAAKRRDEAVEKTMETTRTDRTRPETDER